MTATEPVAYDEYGNPAPIVAPPVPRPPQPQSDATWNWQEKRWVIPGGEQRGEQLVCEIRSGEDRAHCGQFCTDKRCDTTCTPFGHDITGMSDNPDDQVEGAA